MRPRSLRLACCLGVLLALPSAANADVTTFAQAGAWMAFGGTASDGKQVCGAALRDSAKGAALMLKWFRGDAFLTLQAMRTGWTMPHRAEVAITLRIDRFPAWSATASGSGQSLEWALAGADIDEFESEFRKGSSLTLQMPGGGGGPWQASLAGSQAIVQSMVACMKVVHAAPPTLSSGENAPHLAPHTAQPGVQRVI